MNREKAIKWVRDTYYGHWPNSTKHPFPKGWRWVVSNRPYTRPTYKLVNSNFSEINESDVYTGYRYRV